MSEIRDESVNEHYAALLGVKSPWLVEGWQTGTGGFCSF
jgi:hypothetical protein